MKRCRKYPLLVLCALILLSAMVSCSDDTGPAGISEKASTDSNPPTVLRFVSSWGGVDSKAETLKTVLSKFVKDNPDIEVVNESLFGEDFLPKLKTDFASGNNPDVFGLWPGSDIKALVKAGKVADLTSIINKDGKWKRSFDPKMWAYTTYDDKIYGLPVEIIFECLFVNKDLFSKYNIKIPQNYEELKEAVMLFRENEVTPIALNTQAEGTYLYQNMTAALGGKADTENPFDGGKVKSCYIEAMNDIKQLNDLGAFPDDCFTLTNNERNNLFKQKKAAMIVQGSWFIGDFQPDDKTVDIIPFPSMHGDSPNKTLVYGLGGGSFHLSSTAAADPEKKDASVRLLKALTSEETAYVFASETGMISNVDISGYNINYRDLAIKGLGMIPDDANQRIGPPDSFVDRSTWEADISQQFPYFLEGKVSAEEVWNKAIADGIIPD